MERSLVIGISVNRVSILVFWFLECSRILEFKVILFGCQQIMVYNSVIYCRLISTIWMIISIFGLPRAFVVLTDTISYANLKTMSKKCTERNKRQLPASVISIFHEYVWIETWCIAREFAWRDKNDLWSNSYQQSVFGGRVQWWTWTFFG